MTSKRRDESPTPKMVVAMVEEIIDDLRWKPLSPRQFILKKHDEHNEYCYLANPHGLVKESDLD